LVTPSHVLIQIDRLIDTDFEEPSAKISRYANLLRIIIPSTDQTVTVQSTKTLGHLASVGGALASEFLEFELKRALEWLGGDTRQEHRRFAANLVIKELASSAPSVVYPYIPQILDMIWSVIRDSKPSIRESAADALGGCLEIIYHRESPYQKQWYRKIYDEAQKGFKSATNESIHGSLLILSQLLLKPQEYLLQKYRETFDTIFKLRDHKDALVRKLVILLLPSLAKVDPNTFKTEYLEAVMIHLLPQLKKDKEKSFTYTTIGKVAIEVGSHIGPYLEAVVANIKDSLYQKG
jgi:FKBP12-rapamycin complex-associated protein